MEQLSYNYAQYTLSKVKKSQGLFNYVSLEENMLKNGR